MNKGSFKPYQGLCAISISKMVCYSSGRRKENYMTENTHAPYSRASIRLSPPGQLRIAESPVMSWWPSMAVATMMRSAGSG